MAALCMLMPLLSMLNPLTNGFINSYFICRKDRRVLLHIGLATCKFLSGFQVVNIIIFCHVSTVPQHKQPNRQTSRRADKQGNRQIDKRQRGKQTKKTDRKADRKTNTSKYTNTTNTQIPKHINTHIYTHKSFDVVCLRFNRIQSL